MCTGRKNCTLTCVSNFSCLSDNVCNLSRRCILYVCRYVFSLRVSVYTALQKAAKQTNKQTNKQHTSLRYIYCFFLLFLSTTLIHLCKRQTLDISCLKINNISNRKTQNCLHHSHCTFDSVLHLSFGEKQKGI